MTTFLINWNNGYFLKLHLEVDYLLNSLKNVIAKMPNFRTCWKSKIVIDIFFNMVWKRGIAKKVHS